MRQTAILTSILLVSQLCHGFETPDIFQKYNWSVETRALTGCIDENTSCAYWAGIGECARNPGYMMKSCKKSCNQCDDCLDKHSSCSYWAGIDECNRNPGYMLTNCRRSCNQCSTVNTTPTQPTTTTTKTTTITDCSDLNGSCSYWAGIGECSKNPGYMLVNCKKSCNQCTTGGSTTTQKPARDICSNLPQITPNYPAYNYGTIFGIFKNVFTSSDPSKYVSTTPNGQGQRSLFSRTLGRFYTTNAYLYNIQYSDQAQTVEFRVDPRLGTGYYDVVKYAKALGRVPRFSRSRVLYFDIAPGNHPQAGGGSYELQALHVELTYAQGMETSGSLEELLMHEGGHASLQNLQSSSSWLSAASADRNYISIYARNNPNREDITESIIPWYALRCQSSRLSTRDLQIICSAIPNRIAYLDYMFGTDCSKM